MKSKSGIFMLTKLHRAITHGTIRGAALGQGAGGPYVIQRGSGELFITLIVASPAPYIIMHYTTASPLTQCTLDQFTGTQLCRISITLASTCLPYQIAF